MKRSLLLLLFSCSLVFAQPALECERALTQGKDLSIEKDKYLSLNLPFEPADRLRRTVEALNPGLFLKTRSEAHITVLTPQEYLILKDRLSKEEILRISRSFLLDDIQPVCIGMSQARIGKKMEKAYYVVVVSSSLAKIRAELQKAFVEKGGGDAEFKPGLFHPHITLGFTLRDLHESDGAVKSNASCIHPVKTAVSGS